MTPLASAAENVPVADHRVDRLVALPGGGFAVTAHLGRWRGDDGRPRSVVVVFDQSARVVHTIPAPAESVQTRALVALPGSPIVALLVYSHAVDPPVWHELIDTETGRVLGSLPIAPPASALRRRVFAQVPTSVAWIARGTRLVETYRSNNRDHVLRAQDPRTGRVEWSIDSVTRAAFSATGSAVAVVRLTRPAPDLLVLDAATGRQTHQISLPTDLKRARTFEWLADDRFIHVAVGTRPVDRRLRIDLTERSFTVGPNDEPVASPWGFRCSYRPNACDRLTDGRLAIASGMRGVDLYSPDRPRAPTPLAPAIDVAALAHRAKEERKRMLANAARREKQAKEREIKAERERIRRSVAFALRGRRSFEALHNALSSLPASAALKPLLAPYVKATLRTMRASRNRKEVGRQANILLLKLAQYADLRAEALKAQRRLAVAPRKPRPRHPPKLPPPRTMDPQGQQGDVP